MQQQLLVSTCAVAALLAVVAAGLECREASGNCNKCLSYAECGYCGSNGACVLGNVSGPTNGYCAEWDFASCPSSPTTTPRPTATPAPTVAPPPAADSGWTTFGGCNARTNYKPFSLPPVPSPKELWTASAKNPATANSPIINMGLVCFTVYPCNLTCVDQTSGAVQSSIVINAESWACGTPSFVEELIVVQYNGKNEGKLFVSAYSTTGGYLNLVWTTSCGSQRPVLSYGVVSAGGLIFAAIGSQSGHMMAFNASNGERVWNASGFFPDVGCSSWGLTIHNDQVLWNQGTDLPNQAMVGGLDTRTGSAVWADTFEEAHGGCSTNWYSVSASPTVVLASPWAFTPFGSPVNYTAISVGKNPSNRKTMWTFNCTSDQPEYLMSSDGVTAFFLCGDQLMNVDLQTGRASKPYACAGCRAPAIVLKTHILVAAGSTVIIFERESRTQVALSNFTSTVHHIAFSDGLMVASTRDYVYAVSLAK